MNRRSFYLNNLLIFLLVGLTTSGFNRISYELPKGKKPPAVNTYTSTDSLCVLYIESSFFTTFKGKKLIFEYVAEQDGSLTLHGWLSKGLSHRKYRPDTAIIRLKQGVVKTMKLLPGTYLSNVKLNNVRLIKRALKNNNGKYVKFVPVLDPDYPNHIRYKIYISNNDPASFISIMLAETLVGELNPSPPKRY